MTLAKSISQRGGRITDGVWQVLRPFKTDGVYGLFYKIESVPVLLTILGHFITVQQWDKIVDRLRTTCIPSVHRSSSQLTLVMSPLEDSQDSQGSLSNSVEIESQSTALVSSPISTSSLLQSSQSQDDGVAAGNLTTKQLLNRCVSVPREMFTALTTDEQLHHIRCRDMAITRLRHDLSEVVQGGHVVAVCLLPVWFSSESNQ